MTVGEDRGLEWQQLFRVAKKAAKRWVEDDHLAEDVAQDVMEKLHLHPSRDAFAEQFVRAAARNRAIDVIRGRAALQRAVEGHPKPVESYALSNPVALENLIASLPKTQREALELHREGLLDTEIAEQLGVSHGAARTRLSEARKELRRLLRAAEGA